MNSYSTGKVTGTNFVGGLSGQATSAILSSYSTSDVNGTASDYTGGLVGSAASSVKNSFSKGNVDGNRYVGGLIGYSSTSNTKDINNNYSISRVNASNVPVSGFVGKRTQPDANIVFNAYWNPTLATKSTCYRDSSDVDTNTNCTAGTFIDTNFFGATGIPFAALGFDANWVSQPSGYPKLSWQTN